MRQYVKDAIAKNKKIINHITSNEVFIFYVSRYKYSYNDDKFVNLIFENRDFINDMKKVEENPYIIKIHLESALKMYRKTDGAGRPSLRPSGSKSENWLDIFYERACVRAEEDDDSGSEEAADGGLITMPSHTKSFVFGSTCDILSYIFCGCF
jgi:hypothetical protein